MKEITFSRALQVVCDLAQQAVTENEDDWQREILAEQNAALERIETAAPAMLAALGKLHDAASDFAEHGKERHYTSLQAALAEAGAAITAATGGTPTDEAGQTCERCGFVVRPTPTDDSCDCGPTPTAAAPGATGEAVRLHPESGELDYWDKSDPEAVENWQYEVANGDTRQGFWPWLAQHRSEGEG